MSTLLVLVFAGIVAAVAGAAGGVGFVGDVHEGNVEDVDDVLVVERIVYVFAFAAALHQVVVLQEFELVRDGRLRHADGLCDVVDADFVVGDGAEDFHAGLVAEHLEKGGTVFD